MTPWLPEIEKLAVGRPVPIPSRNRCYFVRTPDGRRWVLKVPAWTGAVLAEAVAFLLGRRLALTQPDAAVFAGAHFPGARPRRGPPPPPPAAKTGWLSELVVGTTAHHPELVFARIENPETVALTMVLDLVLFVEDRHKGNMISVAEAGRQRVFAIDFEDAIVGNPSEFAALERSVLPSWKWMPMVRDRAAFESLVDAAARALAALDAEAIGADCVAAERAARIPGAAALIGPRLVDRVRHAPELVEFMRRGGAVSEVEP